MSKGNGVDMKKTEAFIKRIENLHGELDKMTGEHMAACKDVRSDIKEIYTEAKADGIPKNALKKIIEYRRLEKKQQDLGDGLDIDEGAAFEQMIEALGDFGGTALGKAALDKAKGREEQPSKH